MIGLRVISTVPGPIIQLDVLRQQCEIVAIDGDSEAMTHPDDDLLLAYLDAAVDHAEEFTGLSIALRTYEMALDCFPWKTVLSGSWISIPRPPLIRIDSFLVADAGSDGEFDEGDDFTVDDFRMPARLFPVVSWPGIQRSTNAIRIRFTAGYMGDYENTSDFSESDYAGAQPLPASIRQALLLLTKHFWDNRADSAEKALSTIPNGFKDLLRPKRIDLGMA